MQNYEIFNSYHKFRSTFLFAYSLYGHTKIITILKEKLRQIGSGEGKPTERNKLRPHHHSIILLRFYFKCLIRVQVQPPEVSIK